MTDWNKGKMVLSLVGIEEIQGVSTIIRRREPAYCSRAWREVTTPFPYVTTRVSAGKGEKEEENSENVKDLVEEEEEEEEEEGYIIISSGRYERGVVAETSCSWTGKHHRPSPTE